jgi:hypothetical protein
VKKRYLVNGKEMSDHEEDEEKEEIPLPPQETKI